MKFKKMMSVTAVWATVIGLVQSVTAANGPEALPRGRLLLKGAYGVTTQVQASAIGDLSTGGTDAQDEPIAITAKYLKLLTRNGQALADDGWKTSVELDSCEYTAQLKVVNAESAESVSAPFRISLSPLFVDVTVPSKSGVNAITSEGTWRYQASYMFDNILPTTSAQQVASLGTIANEPSVKYQFKSDVPTVVAYSIRPVNTTFCGAATAIARAPKKWTFSGSMDGTNWTELDFRSGETNWDPEGDGEIRYFGFVNTTAYPYYKLKFLEDNGNAEVGISEVEFYTEPNEVLRIEGSPSNYLVPTPAYGTTLGHTLGTTMSFDVTTQLSAHAEDGVRSAVVATGKRVLSLGYRLENCTATTTVNAETLTDYSFVGATRLTWLWQEQYRLYAHSGDAATGSVVINDGDPAASGIAWKNAGATSTVRAIPAEGYVFSGWSGDLAEEQKSSAEITLAHSKARTVTAVFISAVHVPTEITWTGGGAGTVKAWDDPANWDLNTVPGEGDTVTIGGSATRVLLSAPTPPLKKLVLSANSGTLELRTAGWKTKIDAETVEINGIAVVRPSDATVAGASDTNRVWITCRDLTLGPRAKIVADKYGFDSSGPGTPMDSGMGNDGSGHGGRGGAGSLTRTLICGKSSFGTLGRLADPRAASSTVNDSLSAPVLPGSGGFVPATTGVHLHGGGVVRIEATGRVTVNGVISSDGEDAYSTGRGGSAGGSIYITCATIDGSGFIKARGGESNSGSTVSGGGGGGRVAVVWTNAITQATLSPTIDFDLGGRRDFSHADRIHMPGEAGTLYLTDSSFYPRAVCSGGGQVHFATPQQLAFTDFTVTNSVIEIAGGSTLSVSGNLTLQDGGGLILRSPLSVGGNVVIDGRVLGSKAVVTSLELIDGAGLTVGGSMTLSDKGELQAQCSVTNSPNAWGSIITVAGDFTLGSNCGFFPESHPTDLATGPARLCAGNVTIADGAVVDGIGAGWQIGDLLSGSGHHRGYGPGGSVQLPGASHAGRGGRSTGEVLAADAANAGQCYGNPKLPLTPGSGSAGNNSWQWCGTAGGGQIAFFAQRTMTLNGLITMAGVTNAVGTCTGAGSGGSVYIEAKRLKGNGRIFACGGNPGFVDNNKTYREQSVSSNPGKGGGGGGGYVTIRANVDGFSGAVDVAGGDGYYNAVTGEDHRGNAGIYKLYASNGFVFFVR